MRYVALSASVMAALAACSKKQPEPVMCTMEARAALAVVVVDSVTGAGLAGTTLALAIQGTTTDTLAGRDSVVSGAFERPGTYRIELTAPGYRPWTREGVVVKKDECHVLTERLRAIMVPQ
jgi:hypothetical protein